MTNDLGVWTADDCALVLIDYQKEMFEVIRSETSADLVEMHLRLLAKTARAFDVPIVLTTVGVGAGFNGPTLPLILSELEGIEPIDRTSMNAFEDEAFSEAVKATGRKRLIIGGLHAEICLTFATVQALKDGYDVMYVTDGEYFTPDVVWHGGSLGTVSGIENMTGLLTGFLGALPDLRAEEQGVIASDDLVVMRLVVNATHKGDLLGIPATGRSVQWDAVDIYRVTDDGKISEEWAADDMATFASQLGAVLLPWAS
jgi:predicted ester cyclase